MELEEIRKQVAEIRWIQSIDLGNGITTPGLWAPGDLTTMGCPKDLSGMSVLDLCAADGGYTFQAEKLGAASVTATDSFPLGGGGLHE